MRLQSSSSSRRGLPGQTLGSSLFLVSPGSEGPTGAQPISRSEANTARLTGQSSHTFPCPFHPGAHTGFTQHRGALLYVISILSFCTSLLETTRQWHQLISKAHFLFQCGLCQLHWEARKRYRLFIPVRPIIEENPTLASFHHYGQNT